MTKHAVGHHPLVVAAASGQLPDWAVVGPLRREHTIRVSLVLGSWAASLELSEGEALRWRAAGLLHDALRDEDPDVLRREVSPDLADLPGAVLHGPAAAVRLRGLGVADEEVLDAVAWHTLGHPGLGRLGRAVYCADFLEPGRRDQRTWREGLRFRFPVDEGSVVRSVVQARTEHMESKEGELHPHTRAFRDEVLADRGDLSGAHPARAGGDG